MYEGKQWVTGCLCDFTLTAHANLKTNSPVSMAVDWSYSFSVSILCGASWRASFWGHWKIYKWLSPELNVRADRKVRGEKAASLLTSKKECITLPDTLRLHRQGLELPLPCSHLLFHWLFPHPLGFHPGVMVSALLPPSPSWWFFMSEHHLQPFLCLPMSSSTVS